MQKQIAYILQSLETNEEWIFFCQKQEKPENQIKQKSADIWRGKKELSTVLGLAISTFPLDLIIYYNNSHRGKVTFEARDQCGVPGDSSWPPGSKNGLGTPDFQTWSVWEAPTGTWRTWARTSPRIDFWSKFKKHKLLGMIKWVDFRCFRTSRTSRTFWVALAKRASRSDASNP